MYAFSFQAFGLSSFREAILIAAAELYMFGNKIDWEVPANFNVGSCSTNGTTTVTMSSTAGIRPGMDISGTDIPANSYVKSITDSTHVVIGPSVATGTHSGITMTITARFGLIKGGISGQFESMMLVCNHIKATNNLANARVLNLVDGASGVNTFFAYGNLLHNFDSAAALVINPAGCFGVGELAVVPSGYFAGRSLAAQNLLIQATNDAALNVGFDIADVAAYGKKVGIFTMAGELGIKLPIVASGSLPGVSSGNNTKFVVEDTGAAPNLVVYANGARYRVALTSF